MEMNDWFPFESEYLDQTFAGATFREWLIVLVVWAVISLVLLAVHRILAKRLGRLASQISHRYGDLLASVLNQTRAFFLVAVGLLLAGGIAATTEVFGWIRPTALMVVLLQVIIWGNSLINLFVERYRAAKLDTDPAAVTTMQAFGFVGRLALWTIVFLLALSNLGVDITALVAGLGIGGIAVALAVQNILGDLLASLSIVIDKPFAVGDYVIVDTFQGTVQDIGLETTRLRSLSGEEIIFSNSDLIKSRIRNYKRMQERRIQFVVRVVYQTPASKLKVIPDILREAVEAQEMTRFDRAHFKEFGEFALTFEVVYYVLSPEYNIYMNIQQTINLVLYERFQREGIEFAYPTQSLIVEKLPDGVTSNMNVGVGTS